MFSFSRADSMVFKKLWLVTFVLVPQRQKSSGKTFTPEMDAGKRRYKKEEQALTQRGM